MKNILLQKNRNGCKDIWNAFMVEGASMTENDIPICPCTSNERPVKIITYSEAQEIVAKQKKAGNSEFYMDSFVCWYMDDYKFDNPEGVWQKPWKVVETLDHFSGIITPDWSTYADFPKAIKIWNTYRMRAFGYWYGSILGKKVINNVRWGTPETFSYCFDGIPNHSIVSIGSVASDLRNTHNHEIFMTGLKELVQRVSPSAVIVYGRVSSDVVCLLKEKNVDLWHYQSRRSEKGGRK